jgi:LmbE family N-acetylglucosaminyl deacetylase
MDDDLGRLAVISPHLDDGAFSCGDLLACHPGATVITVFAGLREAARDAVTPWDRACGFRSACEAIAARRKEDRAAMAVLGARPCWLDFEDSQYAARPPGTATIAGALRKALDRLQPDTVLLPLGLFHSDHHLTHQAALRLVAENRYTRWLAYEDALYRKLPDLLQQRLRQLESGRISAGHWHRRMSRPDIKRRSVSCYASQLRGLATPGRPGHADLAAGERYWILRATMR